MNDNRRRIAPGDNPGDQLLMRRDIPVTREEPRDVTPPTAALGMDDKLRRISPGDLLVLRDVTPPTASRATANAQPGPTSPAQRLNRSAPSGSEAATTECACGGLGWYSPGPTLGYADCAALVRCSCRSDTDRKRQMAVLWNERDRYAQASFAGFDTERALPDQECWPRSIYDPDPKVRDWCDQWYTPDEQRLMLRGAKVALGDYARQPAGWVWLQGNYGSGKSHLGAAVINALAARQRTTYYDSVPQLIKLLRQGIKDHTVDERLDLLARVDVLMLDDFGMGNVGEWGGGQIEDVINERYNAERPTILTSNLPIEAVSGRIGSRIAGECQVVTLVAYDIRLLQQRSAS